MPVFEQLSTEQSPKPETMTGHVIGIRGSVIDMEFPHRLPAINEAIHIDEPSGRLVVETQMHLGHPN